MEPGEAIEAHANAQVGRVLERKWRLDRVIAVGGMAIVFAATHRNGNRVAIKVLRPDIGDQEQLRERFAQEGYVANRVEHPGAVRVLDDGTTDDGAPFLVMELLDGETLDARAQRRNENLSVREMLLISEQLLEALAAAHAAGIVHRDLKPENLFLTIEGKLKVLDFGIARLTEVGAAPNTATTQTRPGALLGTPAFMSPEQASGRWSEVDTRTDIWAVGATMFTLLSGQHVHEAETVNLQLAHAAMVPAPPVADRFPFPAQVAELIDRALRFQKAERWSSATDMLDAVRAVLSDAAHASERNLPRSSLVSVDAATLAVPLVESRSRASVSSVSAATTALSPRHASPRRPVLMLVLAGVGLFGLLVIGWLLLSPHEESQPKLASTAPSVAPSFSVISEPGAPPPVPKSTAPAPPAVSAEVTSKSPSKPVAPRHSAPRVDEDLYDKRY